MIEDQDDLTRNALAQAVSLSAVRKTLQPDHRLAQRTTWRGVLASGEPVYVLKLLDEPRKILR